MFLVCVEALEGCDESKRGTVEKSSEAVEEFSARDRKQILATQVSEALMSLLLGHRPSSQSGLGKERPLDTFTSLSAFKCL